MIKKLEELYNKQERYVVGLMSGTSVDGIDAALVKIRGNGRYTQLEEIAFENYPYDEATKARIFRLFNEASVKEICDMNFVLAQLFSDAALNIAKNAGISQIDLIGSHGQTIYHIPDPIEAGVSIKSTLQIGDGSLIAHKTGTVTVCDFRTADVAAGGVGAPLVPYTEYLLFADDTKTIALQNIGGIGNITVIAARASADEVIAFDTGPGNMVIDYLTKKLFGFDYDAGGDIAASGTSNQEVITHFIKNEYFHKPLPKTTGRELFGKDFSEVFCSECFERGLNPADIIATATAFTAQAIAFSIEKYIDINIEELIVSGGGAYNRTLLRDIQMRLPEIKVLTQEQIGKNSDAKEAVAFAVLANETISGNFGNLPRVTGASEGKILGKICV